VGINRFDNKKTKEKLTFGKVIKPVNWPDKGIEYYKAGDIEEAIKCFAIFKDIANALYELAIMKRWKSSLEDAEGLFLDANSMFQDVESLMQDIEKCDKPEQLERVKLCFADTYHNWGYALSCLARIKQDKDRKKAERLFQEATEKCEKAMQFNWKHKDFYFYRQGVIFFRWHLINKENNLADEALKYFKKTGYDILGILVRSSEDATKPMVDGNFLYSLLDDSRTNDGRFFKEATENMSKEEQKKLDKYKELYILSMFIISQLYVNDENEKHVAHYSKKDTSQNMLFDEKAKFRLNAINYSNDPAEGRVLLKYLFGSDSTREQLNRKYGAFAGCFTFSYDSLNLFRLYGKDGEQGEQEGTGLSLVFNKDFFSKDIKMAIKQNEIKDEDKKLTLFRCIYIDPIKKRVETVGYVEENFFYGKENEFKNYYNNMVSIIDKLNIEMRNLAKLIKDNNLNKEVVGQLLINLRYLIKDSAFKEEQECRIVKICHLYEEKRKISSEEKDNVSVDDFKMYIEYEPKISTHVKKIYFGPKVTGIEKFQDFLTYKGLNIQCERSKNDLA
jgi:hypothetical protein